MGCVLDVSCSFDCLIDLICDFTLSFGFFYERAVLVFYADVTVVLWVLFYI